MAGEIRRNVKIKKWSFEKFFTKKLLLKRTSNNIPAVPLQTTRATLWKTPTSMAEKWHFYTWWRLKMQFIITPKWNMMTDLFISHINTQILPDWRISKFNLGLSDVDLLNNCACLFLTKCFAHFPKKCHHFVSLPFCHRHHIIQSCRQDSYNVCLFFYLPMNSLRDWCTTHKY